jgi:hypothetical protein
MTTIGKKRTLAPAAPATPPTSPFNSVKRVRLTYTSTNEALQELNAARQEASLAHLSSSGVVPELVEATPKGKGRYKLQWGGKSKSFMMTGTVSAHDVMIKKEVSFPQYGAPVELPRRIPLSRNSPPKIRSTLRSHLPISSTRCSRALSHNWTLFSVGSPISSLSADGFPLLTRGIRRPSLSRTTYTKEGMAKLEERSWAAWFPQAL